MALPRQAFKNSLKNLYNYLASRFSQTVYATDGALGHEGQAVLTKGSAGAYTLSAPTAAEDGQHLIITSATAFAHVITSPSGTVVDGTTGAKTTITCAAFAGASVHLVAYNLKWHLVAKSVATVA